VQSILEHPALDIAGALGVSRSSAGMTPRRLPRWASAQILDPAFQFAVSNASGIRLRLDTDSDLLELDVMLTGVEFPGTTLPRPCFDLVVDGELVAGHATDSGGSWSVRLKPGRTPEMTFRPGPAETVTFGGLSPHAKSIELWLPQNRIVELRDLRISDAASVQRSTAPSRRWIHYGSSISHCSEADRPTNTWPAVAARLAGVDLTNLGFGGQCHLDQVVARTIRDLPADVISAKIGINIVNGDTFRERTFVPALHGFLDTLRDGHPATPILVITPILFPVGEEHAGPTIVVDGQAAVVERPEELTTGALSIGRIRELVEVIVSKRQRSGDANLYLLDGRELFGADNVGDLSDGLHPNTAGYRRMGERFAALAFGEGRPFANGVATAG
jgi:GDSL-like Lipase/Acylhydrolase family